MKYTAFVFQLTLSVLAYICGAQNVAVDLSKDKRQVGQTAAVTLDTDQDRDVAATGFTGAGLGHGKYFQYAHQPAKDHYEFGHRRGNEHHFIERHEKAHPHAGEFKTKVRWGDKHGGYGEHYWDYNHAGHGGDDGEETQNEPQYAEYTEKSDKYVTGRAKRQPKASDPNSDVEFIDDTAKFLSEIGLTGKHGGNYRWENEGRAKRTPTTQEISKYTYDPISGKIVDQNTGRVYTLTPVVAA